MKFHILIITFLITVKLSYSQTGGPCDDCDTTSKKHNPFIKKDYKKYKKKCDLEKIRDCKKAKKIFCLAKYNNAIGNYFASIDLAKISYAESNSTKLKYYILKLMEDNHRKLGDSKSAEVYQKKIAAIIEKYPNIDN